MLFLPLPLSVMFLFLLHSFVFFWARLKNKLTLRKWDLRTAAQIKRNGAGDEGARGRHFRRLPDAIPPRQTNSPTAERVGLAFEEWNATSGVYECRGDVGEWIENPDLLWGAMKYAKVLYERAFDTSQRLKIYGDTLERKREREFQTIGTSGAKLLLCRCCKNYYDSWGRVMQKWRRATYCFEEVSEDGEGCTLENQLTLRETEPRDTSTKNSLGECNFYISNYARDFQQNSLSKTMSNRNPRGNLLDIKLHDELN